jgi:hypothetical protein
VARQPDPRTSAEDRDEQGDPVGVDAARGSPRRAARARRDERLDLDEERPRPLERRGDDAAWCRTVVLGEESPRRIGDLGESLLAHLEDADLLGRPEAVLRGTEQANRGVALALEGEHGIDEVLQCLRPRDRAVFRDVADEDDRDSLRLGELHQAQGSAADLADAPRRAVEIVDRRGLDRVDDEERGRLREGDLGDPVDRRLGKDPDPGRRPVKQAESLGAETDLGDRFLAGRVQDAQGARTRGDPGGRLEEERRLAYPRLAADEDERTRDEPAAEDAVELRDADREPRLVRLADVGKGNRHRPGGDCATCHPAASRARRRADLCLDETVPGRAGAALALPAEE